MGIFCSSTNRSALPESCNLAETRCFRLRLECFHQQSPSQGFKMARLGGPRDLRQACAACPPIGSPRVRSPLVRHSAGCRSCAAWVHCEPKPIGFKSILSAHFYGREHDFGLLQLMFLAKGFKLARKWLHFVRTRPLFVSGVILAAQESQASLNTGYFTKK